MTTSSANGRAQRKSLAEQIDRLDLILDGFADGLNEAVAEAVKLAVTKAVEAALKEVLNSAELQKRLREQQQARPGKVRRIAGLALRGLVAAVQGGWSWAASQVEKLREKGAEVLATVSEGRKALARRAQAGMNSFGRRVWLGGVMGVALARHFARPLLVAVAIGTIVGLACYLAGPTVASFVSGVAGFAGSLIATLMSRLGHLLRRRALRVWYVARVP